MDLTSLDDPGEIREKHFLDSLAPLPMLEGPGSLADLGSGAGFPGLVLAALRPDLTVRSIESKKKKATFQRQVVRELNLGNVVVDERRAEEVITPDAAPRWITARALGSLA